MQESVEALKKVTGMDLNYHQGTLSGTMEATYKTDIGLEIPIHLVVDEWFQNGCLGVLARSDSCIGIMAAQFEKSNIVSVYIMDLSKHEVHVNKKMTLRDAVKAARPAIVASYYWKDSRWNILTLPE